MARPDPFERSLSTSFKGMFIKPEIEVLRRILDTMISASEPETLTEDSHKRSFNEGRRRIFRVWPRDPEGKELDACPDGKFAPTSSPLWGATLYDLYWVYRFPECGYYMSISSGSRLAAWAKKVGELTFAEDEIDWAEHLEADPAVRHASDIGDIIECRELVIMLRACGTSLGEDEWYEDDKPEEEKKEADNEPAKMDVDDTKDQTEVAEVEGEASGKNDKAPAKDEEKTANAYIPPKPFDYANYPMPWPLVPFSANSPKLESPIPYHLLPEKLIVHDPFGVLHVAAPRASSPDYDNDAVDWKAKPDITYIYSLRLTESVKEIIAQERKKIASAASHTDPVVLLTLWPSQTDGLVRRSPVEVTVPPPPPPPSCTPEAHLYISPAESVGRGNHSFVYRAEWDLPKTVFFKPTICETCVREAALDIIQKRDGKLKEADDNIYADGPDASSTGRFVRCTKDFPSLSVGFVQNPEEFQKDDSSAIPPHRTGILRSGQTITHTKYEGPRTRVHVDSVPWYTVGMDPEPCNHRISVAGPLPGHPPPSAQVSVVAKLSIPRDTHLVREAVNYQRFGPHMSEHWTGYTCVHPMNHPTPVGAIVPNFYGYYVKDIEKEGEIVDPDSCGRSTSELQKKYFSPIMLLEDCGTPIDVSTLSLDDRRECSALLLRFHHLGWFHGSFFPRNILMQCGDHADFPLMRSHQDKRFRLIDFGRAESSEDKEWRTWDNERFEEKCTIWKIMQLPFPM